MLSVNTAQGGETAHLTPSNAPPAGGSAACGKMCAKGAHFCFAAPSVSFRRTSEHPQNKKGGVAETYDTADGVHAAPYPAYYKNSNKRNIAKRRSSTMLRTRRFTILFIFAVPPIGGTVGGNCAARPLTSFSKHFCNRKYK